MENSINLFFETFLKTKHYLHRHHMNSPGAASARLMQFFLSPLTDEDQMSRIIDLIFTALDPCITSTNSPDLEIIISCLLLLSKDVFVETFYHEEPGWLTRTIERCKIFNFAGIGRNKLNTIFTIISKFYFYLLQIICHGNTVTSPVKVNLKNIFFIFISLEPNRAEGRRFSVRIFRI